MTLIMTSDRPVEYAYSWRGHAPRNNQENFVEAAKSLHSHVNSMTNIEEFDQKTGSNIQRTLNTKYQHAGKFGVGQADFVDQKNYSSQFAAKQRGLVVAVEALDWKPGTYYNESRKDPLSGKRTSKAGGILLYRFYVYAPPGFDTSPPGSGSPPAGNVAKVWIHNETSFPIHYKISRGGDPYRTFTVKSSESMWHSTEASPPNFLIDYDKSFASGYQAQSYSLLPNTHYVFRVANNEIRLYAK